MKKNFKAKVFTLIALIVLFITAVMANIAINNKSNQTKSIATLTPEERRSMSYGLVTDKDSKIEGNDFVRFNAYFLADLNNDGYAEKYDGTCRNIKEKSMLYMDVNVLTEGKLTNGVITINGQNFNLGMSMIADEVLKNNYISDNVRNIELKDVNAGTQKLILGKITPKIGNDTNKYSCDTNTITFTGTYVPLEGEPVEVNKTIDLTVDWYGITTAQMIKNTKYDVLADSLEEGEIKFSFQILETAHQLILKENSNKVIIPELCGYAPIEVKCTTNGVTSNYDENTRELTISRESVVSENGMVVSTLARNNTYEVSVKYPEDAYRSIDSFESIIFDIEGYYTGYNNKNDEFENPYKSNVVEDKVEFLIRKDPKENIFNFHVDYMDKILVLNPYNKYVISNQDIINAYDSDDVPANKQFVIRWQAERGSQGVVPSMIMSETKKEEKYGDKWDTTLIEDYIENTGIYFNGADEMLGDEGVISVYDNDTNELIKEFTKAEWNTYNSTNPYKYDNAVKHIRVETSTANTNSVLRVFNVKELNTDSVINAFTVEQVKEFNATHTYLTGICNIEGVGARDRETSDIAYFTHVKSRVELSLDKKTAIVYEKLNNQKIRIKALNQSKDDSKWQNGEFLVEVPAEIMNMEINSVTCNKPGVTIEAYELYQDENEKYFIRIITTNDEPDSYDIVIDCNLVPDPRVATVNKEFILYAYNELTHEYLTEISDMYDVNQNNNTTEKVGKAEDRMDILAPTSLITMETITDYDETTDSEITIAPNVALVNRDERQAKINIHLTNNYSNPISDVRILGKIPYENNTYIINDVDLKSEFTTEMTSNGVNIPEELPNDIKQNTTVYYSTKENPTKDLQNAENGWKTKDEVADWSNIKSYLICLNDSKIRSGQEIEFNYDVTLPENVTLNMAAFSTHAVYFNLDTEDGMIRLYTEPTKVGVRIVKKYELDLTKYRLNSSAKIPGVTYSLKYSVKNAEDELVEKQNILTTDENGNVVLKGLFAGIEYTLKEIKTPIECELNDEEITFLVDENENLTLTGENKNKLYNNSKLQLDLEDEIRAKIQINKTKKGTDIKLNNVIFDVADEEGNHITGKTRDGFAEIAGISLNKIYTLTEKSVPSEIQKNNGIFKFRVYRNQEQEIKLETIENTLLSETAELEDLENAINPIVKVKVEDEIRYTLNVLKKDKQGNPLSNIVFELVGENGNVTFATNNDGEYTLSRLNLNETYKLKEIIAAGCYLNSETDNSITFKVERNATTGKLELKNLAESGDTKLIGTPELTEEGIKANLSVVLENEKVPTYKLKVIKKNEDGELLPGARFELKRVDDGKRYAAVTDQNGEIEFEGLCENNPERGVTSEFELTETYAPEGYRLDKTVLKFTARRDQNNKLVFNGIDGMSMLKDNENGEGKEIETDENTVTLGIVNKSIFSIIKYDEGETLLPNAKFVITDLDGNPAKDSFGNYIGKLENGKYIVKTDENGKISANLPHGAYKAIEVEAPEGYVLPEDINQRTYYFGIGEAREGVYSNKIDTVGWEKTGVNGNAIAANDEGIIVINNNSLTHYGKAGNIIWEKEKNTGTDYIINSALQGGYELLTSYEGTESSIEYDGNTINVVPNKRNIVKIKIDDNGNYVESKTCAVESTGSYIGSNEYGNIILNSNGHIEEYNMNGELVSECNVIVMQGSNNYSKLFQDGVVVSKDGYYSYGYTYDDIPINENNSVGHDCSYVIKYDKNGEYQWHSATPGFIQNVRYLSNIDEYIVNTMEAVSFPGHGVVILTGVIYELDEDGNLTEKYRDNQNVSYVYPGAVHHYPVINTMKYEDENGNEKNGFLISIKRISYSGNVDMDEIRLVDEDFHTIYSDLIEANSLVQDKDGNCYAICKSGALKQYTKSIVEPEIQDLQEIQVHNSLPLVKITTEVGENAQGSRYGGTITGEYNDEYIYDNHIQFVENVKYGNNNE